MLVSVSNGNVDHEASRRTIQLAGYLEHVLVVRDDHGLTQSTGSVHDAHQVVGFDSRVSLTVIVLEQPLLEYFVTYRLATGTVGFVRGVEFLAEVSVSREHKDHLDMRQAYARDDLGDLTFGHSLHLKVVTVDRRDLVTPVDVALGHRSRAMKEQISVNQEHCGCHTFS